jgi:hypothetical protein
MAVSLLVCVSLPRPVFKRIDPAGAGVQACSAQQPFCEVVLTVAPGKGGACRQYRRGAVGGGP